MFDFFKRRRREALRAEPFPEAWREILQRNVRHAARLTPDERAELEQLTRIFLAEKTFEGCDGLELTDEIRVTIAGQACLLLLNRETDVYPELEIVLVYPHAYRAPARRQSGAVVLEGEEARLGESWSRGMVVLAWDHVATAGHHLGGGHNVVLHEFAHQLDAEEGDMDGVPELDSNARYLGWARTFGEEFQELTQRLHAGRRSDIDPYGAASPAEFFAVVTEMFFERPRALRRGHPELYAELAAFYCQDPASAAERPLA
ncbi:MAG TPA: zinc-dependent peptidase [Polyangiaceae bacterium]|nr:zinc-dependent peptidase [Polyangiaceae bacterium]